MNSKCGVQSKRKCEYHESCLCIFGVYLAGQSEEERMYEMECRHVAVQRGKTGPELFIAL